MLSNVVIFSILSSESPTDFHYKTLDVLVKKLKYSFYERYIKWFCNVPGEKYLASLRSLYSFIKYFVCIALTLFDSSFNSFSTSSCFVLFQIILLLKVNSLLSKSILLTKLAIQLLLAKFACFNLAAKFSDVNLLNSGIIIYLLLWSWSLNFHSILLLFVL